MKYLLQEQELANLESLVATYATLKGSQIQSATTVRNLYNSDTITNSSQPNSEEGLVSEVKEMILLRMLSILESEEEYIEETCEDSTPEEFNYLTTEDAETLLKLNSTNKVRNSEWEDDMYVYWDKEENMFITEDGELYSDTLKGEDEDKWIVV